MLSMPSRCLATQKIRALNEPQQAWFWDSFNFNLFLFTTKKKLFQFPGFLTKKSYSFVWKTYLCSPVSLTYTKTVVIRKKRYINDHWYSGRNMIDASTSGRSRLKFFVV